MHVMVVLVVGFEVILMMVNRYISWKPGQPSLKGHPPKQGLPVDLRCRPASGTRCHGKLATASAQM